MDAPDFLWYKYDFGRGDIRFYSKRLKLIDPLIVWYMGRVPKPSYSHWDVKPKEQEQIEDKNWPVLKKATVGQRLIYMADGKELHFKSSKSKDYFHKILRVQRVEYIGETNFQFTLATPSKEKNRIYKEHHVTATGLTCCYCNCDLVLCSIQIPTMKTRDHIIPKHKGGKLLMWCCYACNQEKGGMELHVYIQYLCYQQSKVDYKSIEYANYQTKIINANEIAKSLNK